MILKLPFLSPNRLFSSFIVAHNVGAVGDYANSRVFPVAGKRILQGCIKGGCFVKRTPPPAPPLYKRGGEKDNALVLVLPAATAPRTQQQNPESLNNLPFVF